MARRVVVGGLAAGNAVELRLECDCGTITPGPNVLYESDDTPPIKAECSACGWVDLLPVPPSEHFPWDIPTARGGAAGGGKTDAILRAAAAYDRSHDTG